MTKLKSVATATTAITLATVANPTVLAEELQTAPVAEITVTTNSQPTSSAEVKPALDAQAQVVASTQVEADAAQSVADGADKAVTDAQIALADATKALEEAQAIADTATPQAIADNQADQAANLQDQADNARDTDAVNSKITAQTAVVTSKQADVDSAQAALDQANADLKAKQDAVTAAQDALNNTGLPEAQAKLDQATKAVQTAQTNVQVAQEALDAAKKSDAGHDDKLKAAQTDVNIKSDAVDTAKAKVAAATAKVTQTDAAVKTAQDAVNEITNKSVGHDKSAILPFTLQPQEMNTIHLGLSKRVNYEEPASEQELVNLEKEEQHADQLIKRAQNLFGKERINLESQTIKIYTESEKEEWLDIRNLSMEDAIEINEVAVKFLNHLRRQYATHTGRQFTPTKLNTKVIEQALQVAKDYMDKGDDNPDKHNGHDRTILDKYGFQTENIWNSEVQFSRNVDGLDGSNLTNFNRRQTRYHYTMAELKSKVIREIIDSTTNDAHAAWGHARHNVGSYDYTVVSFTVTPKTAMHMHTLSKFAGGETYQPYDITAALLTNEEYIAHLESILPNGENLSQAQANLTQAQTASTNAKAELTKASSDYATALDLKTQAEKVLTDAMATPLQTQVAENNLRLATIALQNAQTRQAEAQQAVDNFSGDIVTKQAKLAEAQTALTTSQATQARATQDLATAKEALATAQAELDALTAEKAKLLAEKDRLVEEAKALAEELDGYTNADSKLDNAKSALDAANATLANARLDAEAAHKKVDAINARLTEQKAKLAELQAQYDKLKAEEDARLAQGGTRVDLPDGSSVVVVGGSGKTTPKLEPGQMLNPDGTITYSRKARQAALPNTGEQESLLALFGVAMLSSLGLAGGRKKRKG